MGQDKYKLLLVEDSDDDAGLFDRTLRRTGLHESFEIVQRLATAEAAIDYLSQPAQMVEGPPGPDIVILDLKFPGRSGLDVLELMCEAHARPVLAVFTTSLVPEDREQAVKLGADLFHAKTFEPAPFSRFLDWAARLTEDRKRNEKPREKEVGKADDEGLPPVGRGVRVMHEGYECMAYRDSVGNWRDWYNGEILSGGVRILRNGRDRGPGWL
jgi:CheY-like chemotaxis protein